MPGHLKALIWVIGIAVPVFLLMRPLLLATGYDARMYRRHTLAWFLITFIAFLSHNFWIFSLLVAISMYAFARQEKNPLALYFVALFAAPHFMMTLPGIGPIENLFDVSHIRTLNLSVLLPFALFLYRENQGQQRKIPISLDLPVILFLSLSIAKFSAVGSLTEAFRLTFTLLVDIWLPYYVASRGLRSFQHFRELASAAALAITVTASIAIFETGRHWLLYEELRGPLGVLSQLAYVSRFEGGPIRAVTVTTFPIILGYVTMFGLGFFSFATSSVKGRFSASLVWIFLLGGLVASLSRGPWVGAAAVALIMVFLGPGSSKRIAWGALTGCVLVLVLSAIPSGQMILELLPFVGTAESETVGFRQRLWDVSMLVFWQNPLLGDRHFLDNPLFDELRQGGGHFVDVTNSYLQVALPYGFVGLALFSSALVLPTFAAWRARRELPRPNLAPERLGRMLIALMAGVLITIATASGIGVIPTLYWVLTGLLASYSQLARESVNSEDQRVLPKRTTMVRNARQTARKNLRTATY